MSRFMQQLAAAPISWGVCEVPGWGVQLPAERVLSEMHQLGFAQTELGAAGYLPTEPGELHELLAAHDLALLGAFVPVVLHDPAEADANQAAVDAAIELLVAADATYFITAPVLSWDWGPRRVLDADAWDRALAGLDDIETRCADHGLVQAVHPHLGTLIERADEVQRVLDHSSAGFTLDTGHLLIGGYDPNDFVADHLDRVRHVHLKDVVLELAQPVLDGRESIMAGVQAGMFCNLGQGDAPIADVVTAVDASGFDGWYVIEQDAAIVGDAPPPGAGPRVDVAASIDYLAGLATTSSSKVRNQPTMEGKSQ